MSRITNAEIYYLMGKPKPPTAEVIFDTLAKMQAVFVGRKGGKLPEDAAATLATIIKKCPAGNHNKLFKRIISRLQRTTPADVENARRAIRKAITHAFTMTEAYRGALANRKRKGTGEAGKMKENPPP